MASTSTNINQFVTYSNNIAINSLPESMAKATYIDLPLTVVLTADPQKTAHTVAVASATYEMRIQIKDFLKSYGFDDLPSGVTAGLVGGAFRYYITGQNPIIGALNNAAYEACNSIDICANNKNVNFVFTIAVEGLDAAAQSFLSAAQGNVIGATFNGLKGGLLVSLLVYEFYVPALELKEGPTPSMVSLGNDHLVIPLIGMVHEKLAYSNSSRGDF